MWFPCLSPFLTFSHSRPGSPLERSPSCTLKHHKLMEMAVHEEVSQPLCCQWEHGVCGTLPRVSSLLENQVLMMKSQRGLRGHVQLSPPALWEPQRESKRQQSSQGQHWLSRRGRKDHPCNLPIRCTGRLNLVPQA